MSSSEVSISSYHSQLEQFRQKCDNNGHRAVLVIQGSPIWLHQQVDRLRQEFKFTVFSHDDTFADAVPQKAAKHQLGSECGNTIFDCRDDLDADALCQLAGTVKRGHWFVLLCETEPSQRLTQRLLSSCDPERIARISKSAVNVPNVALTTRTSGDTSDITYDQQQVVDAIVRVMSGHRKRPLVIRADRGRGKSASLGFAINHMVTSKKINIAITAPSPSAVKSCFEHLDANLLDDCSSTKARFKSGATVDFVPIEELLQVCNDFDLVLVDEAAALGVGYLKQLILRHGRLVFCTTVHGYEGSGRGFDIRFAAHLEKNNPGWKSIKLTAPIRYSDNDPLEHLCNKAFLLSARSESTGDVFNTDLSIKQIDDPKELIQNDEFLEQIFTLLIDAHYKTTPNDLKQILDNPLSSVFVAECDQRVVACALVITEPQIDSDTAQAIYQGTRRIKGQILGQTLIYQRGLLAAAHLSYARVVRIATLPSLQGRGTGSRLLSYIESCLKDKVDFIGTSYGATLPLIRFWVKHEFLPIRIGFNKEASTGENACIALKPQSDTARAMVPSLRDLYLEEMTHLASSAYAIIEPGLFRELLASNLYTSIQMTDAQKNTIQRFVDGAIPYLQASASLYVGAMICIENKDTTAPDHLRNLDLLTARAIQRKPVKSLLSEFSFIGRKQLDQHTRLAARQILKHI